MSLDTLNDVTNLQDDIELKIPDVCEQNILDKVIPYFDNKSCFIDIGASDGWYTYLASKHMPANSKVIGFEPIDFVFEHYSEYVTSWRNQDWYKNKEIKLVNKVVTDKGIDEIDIYKTKAFSGNVNPKASGIADTNENKTKVQATNIDDILTPEQENVFIKIDVEGHELSVLKGGIEYFTNCKKSTVLLELHCRYLENIDIKPNTVIEFLTSRGYKENLLDGSSNSLNLKWYILEK